FHARTPRFRSFTAQGPGDLQHGPHDRHDPTQDGRDHGIPTGDSVLAGRQTDDPTDQGQAGQAEAEQDDEHDVRVAEQAVHSTHPAARLARAGAVVLVVFIAPAPARAILVLVLISSAAPAPRPVFFLPVVSRSAPGGAFKRAVVFDPPAPAAGFV